TVGASTSSVCGVREYAHQVDCRLRAAGWDVHTRWLESGVAGAIGRRFLRDVEEHAARLHPWCIILHYTPFTFSTRGFPRGAINAARRLPRVAPVVTIAHELAYPFGRRGSVGAVLAVLQRAAL